MVYWYERHKTQDVGRNRNVVKHEYIIMTKMEEEKLSLQDEFAFRTKKLFRKLALSQYERTFSK